MNLECDGEYVCPRFEGEIVWDYPDQNHTENHCPFLYNKNKCYIKKMIKDMMFEAES